LGIADSSGFSLDPEYDFETLGRWFQTRAEPMLRVLARQDNAPIHASEIDAVAPAIVQKDPVPLLVLIDKMERSGQDDWELLASKLKESNKVFQFQAARYIGELSGTEVGMTLFYTDLVAKLWGFDYERSAPPIEDFQVWTNVVVSTAFREEIRKFPSTRLWFGHQDNGFQASADGRSLSFARIATRIFAASSNPLQPGVETTPAADSQIFLGWWNDHYDEIARYEPEYERLNQIMKWSMVTGWLQSSGRSTLLEFLRPVEVDRSLWFPTWARERKYLKFRDWTSIRFGAKNEHGRPTETMPLLTSKSYRLAGDIYTMEGGVSLAPKNLLKERPAPSSLTSPVLRRSYLDYAASTGSGGEVRALSGASYNLSTRGQGAQLAARAKDGTKVRTRAGELASGDFERSVFRDRVGWHMASSANGQPIGTLRIARTHNGFEIGWRGRNLDSWHALGKRMSRAGDLEQALLRDSEVEMIIRLPGKEHFAVKTSAGDAWVHLAPEEAPSVSVVKGWDARVSDPQAGVRNIQLAAVKDPAQLLFWAQAEGFLVTDASAAPGKLVFRVEARGPPPGSQKVVSTDKGVAGWSDGEKLYFALADLKAAGTQADAIGLAARTTRTQLEQIKVPPSVDEPKLVQRLRSGENPHVIARTLAEDANQAAKELGEHLQAGLQTSKELTAQGRHAAAIEQLDRLMAVHGAIPEILLRKGIAQIGAGKARRAVETLAEMPQRPLRDLAKFFDEINARLQQLGLRAPERDNLIRLAEYAEMQDLAQRKVIEGAVSSVGHGDQLGLHFKTTQPLGGRPVAEAELAGIHPNTDAIYVVDRPGLNNIDWNAGLQQALRETPTLKVVELSNLPIAHFRPDMISTADGGVARHLGKVKTVPRSHGSYEQSGDRCQNSSEPHCTDERARQKIYLVQ
jgi:hypothetical protein